MNLDGRASIKRLYVMCGAGAIAAGTSGGGVVIWSWMPPSNKKPISGKRSSHSSSLSDYWELTATTHLPGTLLQLKVCPLSIQPLYSLYVQRTLCFHSVGW